MKRLLTVLDYLRAPFYAFWWELTDDLKDIINDIRFNRWCK